MAIVTLAHLDKINIMKIKNKYNIGDYVWIGRDKPTSHKVEGINVSVYKDNVIRVFYRLEGTPIDIIGFTENECFLSKEECINGLNNGVIKGTRIRINSVLMRILLIFALMITILPFLAVQIIHWFFTGTKEPLTYRIISKITDKLLCWNKI